MAHINESEIETEIVPFLLPNSRPDLRAIAVRYFLGLTGTEQGRLFLSRKPKYIELIADLIDDANVDIAKDVSMAVVNLAADFDILSWMPNYTTFIRHVLKSAVGQSKIDNNVSAMALSNLSRSEQSAKKIADVMIREHDLNVSIHTLIEALNRNDGRELEHLASFISNLTQVREVRRLILSKDQGLLHRMLPYISFKESVVKRTSVIAAIRNCCFETDSHEWLLSEEVDILPRLLLPLAGPEEFDEDDMEKLPVDLQYLEPDKSREPDSNIRCMLVEAINQLCALKSCRDFIREKNAYVILRELHKWETDESNITAIENLISLFISDEPEPGMENLNEVNIPEDVMRKFVKADDGQKSLSTS